MRHIATAEAPAAIGPYSQGVVSAGHLFTAGQIALDPATMALVEGGVSEQTERVLDNLRAILAAAGTDFSRVVKATVYLTDMERDFPAYNRVYAEYFTTAQPCRTTLGITALPTPHAIERTRVAAIGSS